jgi:flagellar secretion chaperone FliS
MYGQSYALRARNTYRALDLASRLDGASPHSLVTILYDELIGTLDVLGVAMRTGMAVTHDPNAARARSILITLRAGLDFSAGGDLAVTLNSIYVAMARLLDEAAQERSDQKLNELLTHIKSIATAWKQIAA